MSNNDLEDFDFGSLNSEEINIIDISHNKLKPKDLSCLSPLINLKTVYLGSNPFYGSLEPLKNIKKLMVLGISGTNVDSGLEYLPKSLEILQCDSSGGFKVRAIE